VRKGANAMGNRLSRADRVEILERVSCGETQPRVARAVGCSARTVARVLVAAGGTPSRRSRRRPRSPLRPSLLEREEIRAGIAAGDSFRAIARRIGRAPSTVSREVGGVAGRAGYRATRADDRACVAARRPKRSKLAACPRLRRAVRGMLERRFSPRQISARLMVDYPDDPEMRIEGVRPSVCGAEATGSSVSRAVGLRSGS
jgi:transposase, IS30 family